MLSVPARYIVVVLLFFGQFIVPLLRVNLSIAIISMVNSTLSTEKIAEANSSTIYCPTKNLTGEDEVKASGPFVWDPIQQGLVLGCYFYSFIATSAMGPWIAKKFGFKLVAGISVTTSGILTILLPFAAYQGIGLFVATRILVGAFQGPVIPCIMMAFPWWIPPKSRTFAFSFVSCGFPMGIFATLPLSSLLAKYLGWEWIFYITGSFALLWSVLWFLLMFESPDTHPRMSQKEKNYLKKHIPRTTTSPKKNLEKVPWLMILTSLPFLAIVFSHIALDWTVTITTVLVPTYMTTILNMDITEAGASSGLPYLMGTGIIILSGKLSDILRNRTPLSLTAIRKLYVITALIGPGISVLSLCYTGCDGAAASSLYLVTVLLLVLHFAGTEANILDISPAYCGILFGICITFSVSTGFLAPQISGYVLKINDGLSGWQIIFWITAGINFFAAVFYLVFGSAREQSWSHRMIPDTKEIDEIEKLDPEDKKPEQ